MADDEDASGLFAIDLNSSDASDTEAAEKLPRDHQSEADFQHVRATWVAQNEEGQVCFAVSTHLSGVGNDVHVFVEAEVS